MLQEEYLERMGCSFQRILGTQIYTKFLMVQVME